MECNISPAALLSSWWGKNHSQGFTAGRRETLRVHRKEKICAILWAGKVLIAVEKSSVILKFLKALAEVIYCE